MISKTKFPIPDGVIEVTDDYQINLAHYELLHLKPKGTIIFGKEKQEIEFQFFAGEIKGDGLFARLNEPLSPKLRGVFDYIENHPKTECFVTVVLLQFKMVFIASRVEMFYGAKQKTIRFVFPTRFLKTHRRKFIRIPFNEKFPAQLRFQTDKGQRSLQLKDLSREGLRVVLEPEDIPYVTAGARLKQASLKVMEREMPVGLSVVAVYPGLQAGMRIIAISEEDRVWMRDCIRILMKQILNLPDAPFDDEIEKDPKAKE
jgi:hypothetical protein